MQLTGRFSTKPISSSDVTDSLAQSSPKGDQTHESLQNGIDDQLSKEEKQSYEFFKARTALGKEMGLFAYLEGIHHHLALHCIMLSSIFTLTSLFEM